MNELTGHQMTAIEHLRRWKVGALFMDAGTGKTRVTMEIIRSCEDVGMVIWIGPLRTIRTQEGTPSVCDEIAKWGGLSVPVHYVGIESISASDRIFLETLAVAKSGKNVFCVVDESLKIKNARAKRTKHIIEIGKVCKYRIILNGTPLSRNIVDLWAQMEFLSPKILKMTHEQFVGTFCKMTILKHKVGGRTIWEQKIITGFENLDYLYSLIRHYVYHCDLTLRIKQYFHEMYYALTDEEEEEYQRIKEDFLNMDMLAWKNDRIFMEMTQMMQHCYCVTPGKFRCVDSILRDCDPKRTIIFCKYVKSREECETRYKDCKVLSYQKEALGLNLQDYTTTIYFDKIWDYALREQSTRRTYRTGQEHDCEYYDLTGGVGLERMIDRNIERKISMSEYFKKTALEDIRKEL